MSKSWLKFLLGILFVSGLFYAYLLINVPSVELNDLKIPRKAIIPDLNKYNKNISLISSLDEKLKIPGGNIIQYQKKCGAIHIAMVCAGYNSTFALVTVAKSLLFYRSTPLHFHLLVDEIAKRTLYTLFKTWNLFQVNVTFYSAEEWIPKVSWIPNTHYSGVYGLLKLILPEALSNVDKVLVLDTDVTFLTDILELWELFDFFDEVQSVGLVENQSDWYIRSLSYGSRPWPALGRGFNTGIMLMNLKRLRKNKFAEMWKTTGEQVLPYIPETRLADQDIINAVIRRYPKIVHILDCTWNVQLSDHTISDTCYGDGKKINIIHWNSPRKQDVKNKHAVNFLNMYEVFLELNGNLLRRQLFGCNEKEIINSAQDSQLCSKFTRGSSIIYRTHLFLLEYEYNVYMENDVALVTQCSADRITLLEELSKHWLGTISIALYLTDAEVQIFLEFIRNSDELKNRKNIAYHVVYKDGEFYPVNYLRNIAMSCVSTPYIFQLDIDFLPQYGLYESLLSHILNLNITTLENTALIVPAFETQRYRFSFPTSKEKLIKYLNDGVIYTFRYHVWTKGHAATNYTRWKDATKPYEVEWEPDFEPYLVLSKSAPRYDQRFIGFGWNKVSYVTHLTALGYKCLKLLKDKFVQELIAKYGSETLSKLKSITKEGRVPKILQQN